MNDNLWPDWESGECEKCGKIYVNQFLDKNSSILNLWRAGYWKENIICTYCVDDLTEKERENLK